MPSSSAEVASEWRTVRASQAAPHPVMGSHFVTHPLSARSESARRVSTVQRPAANQTTQRSAVNQPAMNQPAMNQPAQRQPSTQRQASRPQQRSHLSTTAPPFVRREPASPPLSFADLRTDLTSLLTTLIDLPTNAPKSKADAYEMCKVLLELCTVRLHACGDV